MRRTARSGSASTVSHSKRSARSFWPSLVPLLEVASILAGDGEAFMVPIHQPTGRLQAARIQTEKTGPITQLAKLERCFDLHPGAIGALSRGDYAVIHSSGGALEVRWKCAQPPTYDPCLLVMPIIVKESLAALLCMELRGVTGAETIAVMSVLCSRATFLFDTGEEEAETNHADNSDFMAAGSTPEKAAAKLRNRIVSNVVHALRGPLTVVRGYTKMVLSERSGPVNQAQRDYLGIVLDGAEKLAGVMQWAERLLERSEHDLTLEGFDLSSLLRECTKQNEALAASRGLKIVQKAPSERLAVVGDPLKLTTALDALLRYAIRSADTGGAIEADVSDNGSGVAVIKILILHVGSDAAAESLKRAFEAFGPADSDAADLRAAADIVSLHGGMASVSKAEDRTIGIAINLPIVGTRNAGSVRTNELNQDSYCR